MKYRDYYAVLGVGPSADAERIKQAYRRLARKHHPDLNPGDRAAAERFKEIGEAYLVLGDPARRRRYDQIGRNFAAEPLGFGGTGAGPAGGGGTDAHADVSSFFQHLFGADSPFGPLRTGRPFPGRYRPPAGPPPPATTVEISLEEAFGGAVRQLHTAGGAMQRVRIPPGVHDGARLKVRTPEGDAMLAVRVRDHAAFRRRGDDLEAEIPVRFVDAALGGEIEVPTLAEPVRIRVPAGLSGGASLRVPGRGMPRPGGGRGDLVVRVRITVPKDLTTEQKDFVRRFGASEEPPPK